MSNYWIWSNEHGAWWAAHRRGYVRSLAEACTYEAAEAARIIAGANIADMDRPWLERPEVAIIVADAADLLFSAEGYGDQAIDQAPI
jgi:hypothetical protein